MAKQELVYQKQLGALLGNIAVNTGAAQDVQINDIAIDSREISAGSLFCAYPGEQSDGREYISQAIASGAVAVLYEAKGAELIQGLEHNTNEVPMIAVDGLRNKVGVLAHHFFDKPSSQLQVFGITGTNGKTTCCYLLTQALSKLDLQAAMIGTIGVGQLDHLEKADMTTPNPIQIHRQLAQWQDQGISQVCMEVSSHALDQGRVAGIEFFCNLFTNLSHDHLDYHGDMLSYAAAKRRLFTDYSSELVITNADDELGAGLIDLANSGFIASYGDAGDVSADEVQLKPNGMHLAIEANGIDFDVQTRLVGQVNVPNILLLVTTLLSLSTSVPDIQKIVSELEAAPGRMELYTELDGPRGAEKDRANKHVVVDYAHTPDALEKALLSVRAHCEGKLYCVFGCGGDRDTTKRGVMGRVASQHSDVMRITNDNPRSESPDAIAQDIQSGIDAECTSECIIELDREQAIGYAIKQANAQDWVLIAGKGHETTQQIGKDYIAFSDREKVNTILGAYA